MWAMRRRMQHTAPRSDHARRVLAIDWILLHTGDIQAVLPQDARVHCDLASIVSSVSVVFQGPSSRWESSWNLIRGSTSSVLPVAALASAALRRHAGASARRGSALPSSRGGFEQDAWVLGSGACRALVKTRLCDTFRMSGAFLNKRKRPVSVGSRRRSVFRVRKHTTGGGMECVG